MTKSPQPAPMEREELARTIAPRAFTSAAARHSYGIEYRKLTCPWAIFAFVGPTWLQGVQEAYETADTILARLPAQAPGPLIQAVQAFFPPNFSTDNSNIPDEMIVPLDVPMGELRAMKSALDAALAAAGAAEN